jgi:hypothetical protein
MSTNLPRLTEERLNIIFDHVYDIVGINQGYREFEEERLSHLLETLKSMQSFNYQYRPEALLELFSLMDGIFTFEHNSEGTTLWLSMVMAIRDLYAFSDMRLIKVIRKVSVRK